MDKRQEMPVVQRLANDSSLNLRLRAHVARLRRSSFARNVLVVMSGSAAAQAIGLVLSPVISRLFSPADFGVFGSFNAVLTVILAGVTLEYSQALMLPKESGDAMNLLVASCLSTALVAIACLFICLVAPALVQGLIEAPSAWFLAILVLGVIVGGLSQGLRGWCVRAKSFKQTSTSQVVRGVSVSGMQISFGSAGAGAIGLVVGSVLADLAASLYLLRSVLPAYLANRKAVGWKRIKQLAMEYHDFPVYSASQSVTNALSRGLPVLLLNHCYGIAAAGAYAFSSRVISAPTMLVSGALRQVLFQKATETQHCGRKLLPLYTKIVLGLFASAAIPSLVLGVCSPQLFAWVFGAQWHAAGVFTRWLVLWVLFSFCSVPASIFARLIRIQRTVFLLELASLVMRTAALALGGLYLNAVQTILIFSVVGAVVNCGLIFFVGYAVWKREQAESVAAIRPGDDSVLESQSPPDR